MPTKDRTDEPTLARRATPRKRGPSTLLVVLLVGGSGFFLVCGIVFVLLLGAVGATLPTAGGSGSPVERPGVIGQEMRFGDLGVTVTSIRQTGYGSHTAAGRQMGHNVALVVSLRLKNYNPNRVLRVPGQSGSAKATDDVGNEYPEVQPVNEWGLENTIDGQIEDGTALNLRSDVIGEDRVIFSRPVPGANVLTVTMDAAQYDGGSGKIVFRVPRSVWLPK
jgi:hypothetical protein